MKVFASTCLGVSLVLASFSALAQDAMKKDSMAKDPGTTMAMTMQQCKDHIAMTDKAGAKRDEAMMKKDSMCNDLMKKDGALPNSGMVEPKKK